MKSKDIFQHSFDISQQGIDEMRLLAKKMFKGNNDILIGINGSYARREATHSSDADLFFLYKGNSKKEIKIVQKKFLREIEKMNYGKSASDGVFASPLCLDSICQTIGGQSDSNMQTTQRMLLLLEGDWIFNKSLFQQTVNKLLVRYVPSGLRKSQICLYLLNDIIRYWRTICVDYEFKITHLNKPRYLRLIKLRFSRKLLYFAGILAVAATFNLSRNDKLKKLKMLFAMPPLQRVQHLLRRDSHKILELYGIFLSHIADESIREVLLKNKSSFHFENLRKKAREFDGHLLRALQNYCGKGNPTLHALWL